MYSKLRRFLIASERILAPAGGVEGHSESARRTSAVEFVYHNGDTITIPQPGRYVVGAPLDPRALEADQGTTDFAHFAARSVGQFLAIDYRGERWRVATDHYGIVPLYVAQTATGVAVSNDLQHLAERYALRMNRTAVVEMLSTREGITWGAELFDGVRRIEGASIVTVGPNAYVATETYSHEIERIQSGPSSPEMVFSALDDALSMIARQVPRSQRLVVDVTGGYDTRQILSHFDGQLDRCIGRVVSSCYDEDSKRALVISRQVGLDLDPHRVTAESLLAFHMAFHCTRNEVVDDYYAQSGTNIHMCGMAGSELMSAETDGSNAEKIIANILAIWKLDPAISSDFTDLEKHRQVSLARLRERLRRAVASGVDDPISRFWMMLFVTQMHGQLFERALLRGCRLVSPYLISPVVNVLQRTPRSLKCGRSLSNAYLERRRNLWRSGFSEYNAVLTQLSTRLRLTAQEEEALCDHGVIDFANWRSGMERRGPKSILRWRGLARYLLDGFEFAS